ncbi:MAG: hypothetical protein FWE33_06355 [Defluviitaleaceae bacterium]|nr:hypothetical protein [Defluviitaleaceae bacterium]
MRKFLLKRHWAKNKNEAGIIAICILTLLLAILACIVLSIIFSTTDETSHNYIRYFGFPDTFFIWYTKKEGVMVSGPTHIFTRFYLDLLQFAVNVFVLWLPLIGIGMFVGMFSKKI